MANKENLKIRLREQGRIYRDSPNVQVTYVDLARAIEDLSELVESNKEIGFTQEPNHD